MQQTLARFAWPLAFVAVAAMGFGYFRAPEPPAAKEEVKEGPTLVQEIRALSRLETTSMHLEKVIDLKEHQTRFHGLVESEDRLLYVAVGEVILGVDLTKADVQQTPNGVTIELPAPEVLSTRFDEARSHVHSRSTDMLAQRNEGLEAAARQKAQAAFAEAGRDPKAIEGAKAQAERELRALAKAWGAKELTIVWRFQTEVTSR